MQQPAATPAVDSGRVDPLGGSLSGFLGGFLLGFAVLQAGATLLGSDRGQAGLLVGAAVVASLLLIERWLYQPTLTASARALGLGRPTSRGLATAGAAGVLLLLVIPLAVRALQATPVFEPDWHRLLPGLFAQAGVAEETLFRGYLFGHLRRRHAFWQAAARASLPFVIVHLLLFMTLPREIALAALLLSLLLSFPLAHLFELGGNTIWGAALLHFIAQGALKVVTVSAENSVAMPLVWMTACALLPLLVFLVPRRDPAPVPR